MKSQLISTKEISEWLSIDELDIYFDEQQINYLQILFDERKFLDQKINTLENEFCDPIKIVI